LYLFTDEERLHMAQHRLLFESWLLLPKISEEFVCWEKVGLVLYIKDIWRMARFANIFSPCFNFLYPTILDILLLRSIGNIPMIF
jgi:hypothetical protein